MNYKNVQLLLKTVHSGPGKSLRATNARIWVQFCLFYCFSTSCQRLSYKSEKKKATFPQKINCRTACKIPPPSYPSGPFSPIKNRAVAIHDGETTTLPSSQFPLWKHGQTLVDAHVSTMDISWRNFSWCFPLYNSCPPTQYLGCFDLRRFRNKGATHCF